ncbi:SidA/IucD/PvdA family monooxygenase [Streptomyces sp. NPDC058682]|uniref:SidA/IucD/PvdA family monooxygenase n=1 Tax=Streptomyces sp. NPDC058682 TaxID=3346596 RepID=UPI0036489976
MQEGRVFRFLEANRLSCSRREFEQYFQWAAAQLPSVRLDTPVESVTLCGRHFEVTSAGGDVRRRAPSSSDRDPRPTCPTSPSRSSATRSCTAAS